MGQEDGIMGFFDWLFGTRKKKRVVRDSRPVWLNEDNDVLERVLEDPREREKWKRVRVRDVTPRNRLNFPEN